MFQQTYSVGDERDLVIDIKHGGGDLFISGTDESYLRVKSELDDDDDQPAYQHGTFTLTLHDNCMLSVPRALNIEVHGNVGDLRISDMAGNLTLSSVHGDVMILGATGSVELEDVSGDLRASDLGSLKVSGGISGDVVVSSVAGAVQLSDVSGDLAVSEAESVEIGDVSGSARFSEIRGACRLQETSGDLIVRNVHQVSSGEVHGDLRASNVEGDISAGSVSGDAKVHGVKGSVSLSDVGGDVRIADVEGPISSISSGGDIHVSGKFGKFGNEGTVNLTAGSDIVLTLPSDANAQFECAAGGDIINRFVTEQGRTSRRNWKGSIGSGGPLVRLNAGGDIKIKAMNGGDMEFRFEINKEDIKRAKEEMRRAKEHMKQMRREMRDFGKEFGKDFGRDLNDEIRESIRKGMDGIPNFRFGANIPRPPRPPRPPRTPHTPHTPRSFSWSFGGFGNRAEGGRPQAKAAPKQGPSDEERMTILKMLEEKRITPEQAELLLGALGDE